MRNVVTMPMLVRKRRARVVERERNRQGRGGWWSGPQGPASVAGTTGCSA